MKPISGKQLVKDQFLFDCPDNDQAIFSMLYDVHSPALLGLILKWIKEKEIAEMLLLNTFVKAWQLRKLFDAKIESFYYWLCRLARICYHENLYN